MLTLNKKGQPVRKKGDFTTDYVLITQTNKLPFDRRGCFGNGWGCLRGGNVKKLLPNRFFRVAADIRTNLSDKADHRFAGRRPIISRAPGMGYFSDKPSLVHIYHYEGIQRICSVVSAQG